MKYTTPSLAQISRFFAKKLIANNAKIALRVKEEPLKYVFSQSFLFDFACFAYAVVVFPVRPDGACQTVCILAMCNVFRLQTLLLHLLTILCRIAVLVMMFWRLHLNCMY